MYDEDEVMAFLDRMGLSVTSWQRRLIHKDLERERELQRRRELPRWHFKGF